MDTYEKKLALAKEALDSGSYDKETIEYIFPELFESEDEKIRKEIITHCRNTRCVTEEWAERIAKWTAWLEAQGEQKSLDDVAKEVTKNKETATSFLKSCGIMNANGELADEYKIEQGEQKPAWSEEDEEQLSFCCAAIELSNYSSDEYRNYAISFLESLKERMQPQPKWSEEDEIALVDALWCCKQAASIAKDENDMGNVWYTERWLKSLRPYSQWKPSDEQIEALESTTANCAYSEYQDCLRELIAQLKKLKEE